MIILVGDKSLFEDAYVVHEYNALFAMNLFDFSMGRYNLIENRLRYKENYDEEIKSFLPYFDSMRVMGFL